MSVKVASTFLSLLVTSVSVFGQTAGKDVALRCGALFDGRGESLRKNVVLVIEGEKIKDVSSCSACWSQGDRSVA